MTGQEKPVAILLSTYNGARFLPQQLDSLTAQTHRAWTILWRDDGSSDGTVALMRGFGATLGPGRFQDLCDGRHLHILGSFLRLLDIAHAGPAELFAFSDQDDVWLPGKLARGAAALAAVPADVPALYCARQTLVDASLRRLGESPKLHRPPGFPAALAQNIATGCTIMLNRAAAGLVLASTRPEGESHDWWCYLVVSAAGGRVIADHEPALLYRQHRANTIGAPQNHWRRFLAAVRRGPRPFIAGLRANVASLRARPDLLSPEARRQLEVIASALDGGPRCRLSALRLPGFRRQTLSETIIFYLWFLMG
jgi:hypothetical protein